MKNVYSAAAGDIPALRSQRRVDDARPFPVLRVCDVGDRDETRRWLIENIWPTEGVGVLAASPKIGKTWVTLEIAVAVASGRSFLSEFKVPEAGPVLMFNAEDRTSDLKERLAGICRAREVELHKLNIQVIDAPAITLNHPADFARLAATVKSVRPKLLVLDPFVRMFRGSENDAGVVSRVLGHLRVLQREQKVAIQVVHHFCKRDAAGNTGANIRGTGDFHAWGDTATFLRRHQGRVQMRVEHRTAPSGDPYLLQLTDDPDAHLELVSKESAEADEAATVDASEDSLRARALTFIRENGPANRDALARHLGVRNERVRPLLDHLALGKLIARDGGAWVAVPPPVPVPAPQ